MFYKTDLIASAVISPFILNAVQPEAAQLFEKGLEIQYSDEILGKVFNSYGKIINEQQVLVIELSSKMKKSSVNNEGEVVSGSKDDFIDCQYKITLVRKIGLESSHETSIDLCPNCRSSIKVNDDGVCEHCKIDIATGEFGWVIIDVKKEDIL